MKKKKKEEEKTSLEPHHHSLVDMRGLTKSPRTPLPTPPRMVVLNHQRKLRVQFGTINP